MISPATTTFRWTIAVAGAFILCCTLFLFGFVYWQAAAYVTANIDGLLTESVRVIASEGSERRLDLIEERLRQDPRRIRIAGLFGADGHRIAGKCGKPAARPCTGRSERHRHRAHR
jgi:hypothetical protein